MHQITDTLKNARSGKAYIRKKRAGTKYPNIVRIALELQCSQQHLYSVLEGLRPSITLINRLKKEYPEIWRASPLSAKNRRSN